MGGRSTRRRSIGMVGIIDDVETIIPQAFRHPDDDIVLLGDNTDEIGGSEYLYVTADLVAGQPPAVDLDGERALQQAVLKMIGERLVSSAHDVSEGGLACALAEAALGDGEEPHGVVVELDDEVRPVAALFGEAQGRILISCAPDLTSEVLRIASLHEVPARKIGTVAGPGDPFRVTTREASISAPLEAVATAYFGSIAKLMDSPPTGS